MKNRLRTNSLIAVVIGLLLCMSFTGFGQNPIQEIKQESKAAKLTPDLLSIQQEAQQKTLNQKGKNLRQAAAPDEEAGLTKVDRTRVRNGKIAIEAVSNYGDGKALLTDLQALGLTDGKYYQRIVSGYFPIDKLDQLRSVVTLRVARPSYAPFKNIGKVTSQGDRAMRSDVARQTYNVTGVGSKVGILSDSYDALKGAAAGVASGDLPNVQVLKDFPIEDDPNLIDEGRGMAEIVHDVAPGAAIAFYTAWDGQVDFAIGIQALAAAGCNIIVDDIFYYAEPFFQDGIIAQSVDNVVKEKNVSYFSSAGNSARMSYASGFRNSGKTPPGFLFPGSPVEGHAHDFTGNGTIFQKVVIAPGGLFFPIFQWSDPFYSQGAVDFSKGIQDNGIVGAKTDMDILVYRNGVLQPQLSSIDDNIAGGDPIEGVYLTNTTRAPIEFEIAFVKFAGPDPSLIKWIDYGGGASIQFVNQSSTTVGHANSQKAIAVGAARYDATPAFNPALTAPIIEPFSSAGGTPILFTEYGQPIPRTVRLKPEIVAADGGNNTFFPPFPGADYEGDGFPNFFGTSASAPHAAAVAALIQEKAKLGMSRDDILKRLETTAIDMDDPSTPGFDVGFDFRTGFGFIQADKALTFGDPLAILEPIYDCQTGRITLRTTGGDGSPISFILPGVIRSSPTSTTGIVESGVRNDPKPITITAIQNGVSVSFSFNLVEYCARPRVFALLEPVYNCATGQISFRTEGGNGSTITYTAPGVQRSSLTDPNGVVEAGLRGDPKPITITAEQSGVVVTYVFDFAAYCRNQNRARVASSEPGSGLQVTLLGNPILTDQVEVEVRGVQGQSLKLQVNNTLGELTSHKAVEVAESVERHKVLLGRSAGMYFLKVSTPGQTKTVKVIRQ